MTPNGAVSRRSPSWMAVEMFRRTAGPVIGSAAGPNEFGPANEWWREKYLAFEAWALSRGMPRPDEWTGEAAGIAFGEAIEVWWAKR